MKVGLQWNDGQARGIPYVPRPLGKSPSQYDTFAFESLQRGIGLTHGEAETLGSDLRRDRPADFEQPTQHGDARLDRVPIVTNLGRHGHMRIERRIGKRRERDGNSLGGGPRE